MPKFEPKSLLSCAHKPHTFRLYLSAFSSVFYLFGKIVVIFVFVPFNIEQKKVFLYLYFDDDYKNTFSKYS